MKYKLVPRLTEPEAKRSLVDYSGKELIELYDKSLAWLRSKYYSSSEEMSLRVLKLYESVVDEGRRREILFFMTEQEEDRIIKEVFFNDEDEKKESKN